MAREPKVLQEAAKYFADPANCRAYLVARRWPNGVACPRCGSQNVLYLEKYHRWHCRERHGAPQFTLKTGTIMEDSPIGLDKWMLAMWQIVNCKDRRISSYEVHRAIGVTQKTAWSLEHRIRLALRLGALEKISRDIEVDDSIGTHARSTPTAKRARRVSGTRPRAKSAGMATPERGGEVRSVVVPGRKRVALPVNTRSVSQRRVARHATN